MLSSLWQDLRFALRNLLRTPGFTVAAVLTLALGIGAATSVFSVAYGVLLAPLPFRDPSQLYVLHANNPTGQPSHFPLSGEEFKAFAREQKDAAQMGAYFYYGATETFVRFADTSAVVAVATVTGGLFDVLGAHPQVGRLLRPDDDISGSPWVVVASDGFWRRAFGGSPSIVGAKITVNSRPTTIVGVAPPGLALPAGTDLWLSSAYLTRGDTLGSFFDVVARFNRGTTVSHLSTSLGAFLRSKTEPHSGPEQQLQSILTPVVLPLSDVMLGDVRPAIRVVGGAVALLLLVTCINVANLLLIRAVGRRREFAVRAALGAGRGRIARQVLVESGVLAATGGALGVAAAWAATRLFVALAPAGVPRIEDVGFNGPVVAVALVLSIGVALFFGAFPAAMSSRLSLVDHLRERRDAGNSATHRARSLLVGAQVTVAIAVLVAAGVVIRNFDQLIHLDLGFRTSNLALVRIGVADTMFAKNPTAYLDALTRIRARMRAMPGVANVTEMLTPPFHDAGLDVGYSLPGDPPTGATGRPMIDTRLADENYFKTLGIRLLRGRVFTADDNEQAARVTVVDETLARQVWPHQNPLGQQIGIGTTMYTVVGVVGETNFRDYFHPRQTWYIPVHQAVTGWRPGILGVRTLGDPALLFKSLNTAVHDTDPHLYAASVSTLDEGVDATMETPRLDALLLGGFAAAILLLTALGLYSIAATYVRKREYEIGLRIALGAQYGEVVRLVVRQGIGVVVVGAVAGLVVAIAGAGVLQSVLYDVSPRDPRSVVVAITAVLVVALLAFYLPVRRAARANPADALRAN